MTTPLAPSQPPSAMRVSRSAINSSQQNYFYAVFKVPCPSNCFVLSLIELRLERGGGTIERLFSMGTSFRWGIPLLAEVFCTAIVLAQCAGPLLLVRRYILAVACGCNSY